MTDGGNERVLLSLQTEALEASRALVSRAGFNSCICLSVEEILHEIEFGAGALVIGREMLTPENIARLGEVLHAQPTWSHLPVIVIGEDQSEGSELASLEPLGNVTWLDGPVRVGGFVSTLRSAISYRRRQYEVRDLLVKLEQSHQAAVEANRAKSDFLANVSHEIRTPLGAVLGFSELLMEPGLAERERQIYMTAVKRNGQMLSALIDDILDLAKVESGRVEIERIEFSIGELLAEIVSALEPKASKKGLPLYVQQSANVPSTIVTDPIRLKQVLLNILGNAIKFTSHGSITARVDARTRDGGQMELVFEVEDTGVGIAPRMTDRLFRPFTQADSSTTRRFGGTGLGLVLAQKLARAMGGDVSLKWSIPGGGSCFEVRVSIEARTRVSHLSVAKQPQSENSLPLAGTHILVVDDSLDNQMLIGRILRLLGSEVDVANDGQEAIEKALARPYDVVLMDLQMPRLGGVEATRRLREQGYKNPIVALTAHALKEDRQRCLSVGCTDYLTKPIQRSHLVQVLERVARGGSEYAH